MRSRPAAAFPRPSSRGWGRAAGGRARPSGTRVGPRCSRLSVVSLFPSWPAVCGRTPNLFAVPFSTFSFVGLHFPSNWETERDPLNSCLETRRRNSHLASPLPSALPASAKPSGCRRGCHRLRNGVLPGLLGFWSRTALSSDAGPTLCRPHGLGHTSFSTLSSLTWKTGQMMSVIHEDGIEHMRRVDG